VNVFCTSQITDDSLQNFKIFPLTILPLQE